MSSRIWKIKPLSTDSHPRSFEGVSELRATPPDVNKGPTCEEHHIIGFLAGRFFTFDMTDKIKDKKRT